MAAALLTCINDYMTMRDGVRLALSAWLPEHTHGSATPVVLITTRYWRALAFHQHAPQSQPYYPLAAHLAVHGYALAVVDARGTGASFGMRQAETDPTEVADIGDVIQWLAQQPWCDGRVVTTGTSYMANTTLYSLVTAPTPLKLGVCRAPDFDMYRHLFAPGGLVNRWFIKTWGAVTAAQDANDVSALYANGYWAPPQEGPDNVLGVLPVGQDQTQLATAVNAHRANFNIAQAMDGLDTIEGFLSETNRPLFDRDYQQAIEANGIPVIIRCGWHDAGTALGALAMFTSFNADIRVILGPWNHQGNFLVDPFLAGDGTEAIRLPQGESARQLTDTLHRVLEKNQPVSRGVDYFTLGENRWKASEQWPLPHTHTQRWYLDEGHQLAGTAPTAARGSDSYSVDPGATTGRFNRWYAQSPDQPVLFPDRQQEDKKLLIYDTPPLQQDTEITGHPVIHLWLLSSASDGQFFVYLETVDSDGRVRLLSEGQLRGSHRQVSADTPPYSMFGPYHSLKAKDMAPMVPGEITEIAFDLFPLSVLLQKGQRIRIAIAGADADTFDAITGCEAPTLTVERNRVYASYVDLPIIPNTPCVTDPSIQDKP